MHHTMYSCHTAQNMIFRIWRKKFVHRQYRLYGTVLLTHSVEHISDGYNALIHTSSYFEYFSDGNLFHELVLHGVKYVQIWVYNILL